MFLPMVIASWSMVRPGRGRTEESDDCYCRPSPIGPTARDIHEDGQTLWRL